MAEPLHLPSDHVLRRVRSGALVAGVVGLVLSLLGLAVSSEQFFHSYLVAYLFWLGIGLGSLAILMLQYITGGRWGAVSRRVLESSTGTLPLLALLFLPLAAGIETLYVWARPDAVAHDPIVQAKQLYLNVPFFLARAAVYFAAWLMLARLLRRWSLEQDAHDDPAIAHRLEQLSRGGIAVYGITMTFAAIDWGMSLEPHWFSTIYGVIFMGGQGLSTFAFVIPVLALVADRPEVSRVISNERFHDLGKLLLGFVMLWGYFMLSQFLIVWSADLPEETPWYIARTAGGWLWLSVGLVVAHFVVPFIVLLSRDVKRRAGTIAAVAVGLLLARFLDLFWLLRPASTSAAAIHWLDLATLLAIGGLWLWVFVGRLGESPLLPLHDPALAEEG